jgi:hypothetical protein
MSQFDFEIFPYVDNGVDLSNKLNNWRDALESMHIGTSRPPYAQKGTMWMDDTDPLEAVVYLYDGNVDIEMGIYNLVTGEPANNALTYAGVEPPEDAKERSTWFETDSGRQYILYKNPDGTQIWVESSGSSIPGPKGEQGIQGPQGITADQLLNTTNNVQFAQVLSTGDVIAYSDERLKANWESLGDDFIERLSEVKVGTYERIDKNERQLGVSANDMQKVVNESVTVTEDGTLAVAYGQAALAACVEMAKAIVALKAEIKELKNAD